MRLKSKIFYCKIAFLALLLAVGTSGVYAQTVKQGKISYITSKNVYVKFDATKGIGLGDTLRLMQNGRSVPALVVRKKSSTSCVCTPLAGRKFNKGDRIYAYITGAVADKEKDKSQRAKEKKEVRITTVPPRVKSAPVKRDPQYINGKIGVASYTNFKAQSPSNSKLVYRFSLDAGHIANSNLSFSSYLNYRQIYDKRYADNGRETKFFRVYDLALRYELDSSLLVVVGRHINPKVASIGVIDGLQAEKMIGPFFVGGIAGFRPDFTHYAFSTDRMEFGGYAGFTKRSGANYSLTTLGIMEQRYDVLTDRRFAYFQHSSMWGRKLNFFGSFEIDLFKNINGETSSDFRLTNMYISSRYRFSRKFSLQLSYDSRLRIVYYETFKTEIEKLLDDEARQGVRFRATFRPIKYMNSSISLGKRFQRSGQNASNNINAYVGYGHMPGPGGRMTFNYNWNRSNYLESNIFSLRYNLNFFHGHFNTEVYYRKVFYRYLVSQLAPKIDYIGLSLRYHLSRHLYFGVLGEYAPGTLGDKYRINGRLTYRIRHKGQTKHRSHEKK